MNNDEDKIFLPFISWWRGLLTHSAYEPVLEPPLGNIYHMLGCRIMQLIMRLISWHPLAWFDWLSLPEINGNIKIGIHLVHVIGNWAINKLHVSHYLRMDIKNDNKSILVWIFEIENSIKKFLLLWFFQTTCLNVVESVFPAFSLVPSNCRNYPFDLVLCKTAHKSSWDKTRKSKRCYKGKYKISSAIH